MQQTSLGISTQCNLTPSLVRLLSSCSSKSGVWTANAGECACKGCTASAIPVRPTTHFALGHQHIHCRAQDFFAQRFVGKGFACVTHDFRDLCFFQHGHFIVHYVARNVGLFNGECAAEAAAFAFVVVHDALHVLQASISFQPVMCTPISRRAAQEVCTATFTGSPTSLGL